MNKQKVNIIHSLGTRILLAIVAVAVIASAIIYIICAPNMKKSVIELNENYITDLSVSYGIMVEHNIENMGYDKALDPTYLDKILAGKGLAGIKSSYIYVVSADGIMLYHPTPEKIGSPVENEAVKKTVEKIKSGSKVENGIIKYVFKGANKYAAIYVDEGQNYILVATADEDEMFKPVDDMNKKAVIAFIVMGICAIAVGLLFVVIVIKPINKAIGYTRKIADMDLTSDVGLERLSSRKDEVGVMAYALDELRSNFANMIVSIKEHSANVLNASDALSNDASETATTMGQVEGAVNDIADGASSQAEDTQVASDNVITMGNMIEETHDEVQKLLSYAADMKNSTDSARSILSELEKVNRQAEDYIDVISKQTTTTNESAIKISEATKLITAIAEETNLLSLNASIEAARAGEQGRGFAVVAAEIQKLAEQSNESAGHIEEIIQELIVDSEKAVETMFDVKEIIRLQSDHVEQTDIAFAQIDEGVKQSIQGINSISDKTDLLDEARASVVDVVQNLTAIAEENAAGSQQTSASVTEVSSIIDDISNKSDSLKEIASNLESGINVFKL